MADAVQLENMLRMLLNALGGGTGGNIGGGLPSNLNLSNVGRIQPSMLSQMLGGVFPSFQAQAPPTMLVSHFEEAQRRGQWRQRVNDYYMGYSPTAIRALEKMGVQRSALVDETGQPTTMGRWISKGWNATMGPMIGDPQVYKAQTASMMRDMYQGVYFGRRGAASGFGLSDEEITRNVSTLHNLAFKGQTGLFKRGSFNARDMFEVQSLGVQRGMMVGGDVSQLGTRTEALAKTIKTGMAVFHTLNKEKVLENLQRMTQGTVGLQNTGQMDALLMKVAGLAKAANVSVETMSRIAAEGASIHRQMGITGTAGAVAHMQTAMTARLATSRVAGANPLISAGAVARAGGMRNVTAIMQQNMAGFMGSNFTQNAAFFARANLGNPMLNELARAKMLSGNFTPADVREGIAARAAQIAKEQHLDPHTARQLARADLLANRASAASDEVAEMQTRGEGFDVELAMNRAQFNKLARRMPPGLRKFLTTRSTNERTRNLQVSFLAKKLLSSSGGDAAVARVRAERMLGFAQGDQQVIEDMRKQFNLEQLSEAQTEAKELTRPSTSAAERVLDKFAAKRGQTTMGDIFNSVLMGSGSKLQRFVKEGMTSSTEADRLLSSFDPTSFYMNQIMFSTPQEKMVRDVLAGIAGQQVLTKDTAMAPERITALAEAIGSRKKFDDKALVEKFAKGGQLRGATMKELTSRTQSFFRNKEVNMKTMEEFLSTTGIMGAQEARKWLKNGDNVASILQLVDRSDMGSKVSRFSRGIYALKNNIGLVGEVQKSMSSDRYKKAQKVVEHLLDRGDANVSEEQLLKEGKISQEELEAFKTMAGANNMGINDIASRAKLLEGIQETIKEQRSILRNREDQAVSDAGEKSLADIKDVFKAATQTTTDRKKALQGRLKELFGDDFKQEHRKEFRRLFMKEGPAKAAEFFRSLINRGDVGEALDFKEGMLTPEMTGFLLGREGETLEDLKKETVKLPGGKSMSIGALLERAEKRGGGTASIVDAIDELVKWLQRRFGATKEENTEPKTGKENPDAKE